MCACAHVRVRVCACARVWLRFHQTRARKQATAQHGTAHGRPGVTPLRHTNRGQANNQGHKPDIRRPGAQSVKPDWRTIRFIIGVVRVHTERGIPIVGHHTRAKAQTITPTTTRTRAHAHTRGVWWCGVVWCGVPCSVPCSERDPKPDEIRNHMCPPTQPSAHGPRPTAHGPRPTAHLLFT